MFILTNCSLNKYSKYSKEYEEKRIETQKKWSKILKNTDDITYMTPEEYNIYIDDHTKQSKYPDIT